MPHLTITEAIGRLRDLHLAGFDLPGLVKVAREHAPELETKPGLGELAKLYPDRDFALIYRDRLAMEIGSPDFSQIHAIWPTPGVYGWIDAAAAYHELPPRLRAEALQALPRYLEARERLCPCRRLPGLAAYLSRRLWETVR